MYTALEQIRGRLSLREMLNWPPIFTRSGKLLHPVGGGTTTTAYPDPHPEIATVDGYTYGGLDNQTFANARAQAGLLADDSAVDAPALIAQGDGAPPDYQEWSRLVYLFDLTAIADTDSKDSATFEFTATFRNDPNSNNSLSLVQSSPASNTALVASDFNIGNWPSFVRQATDLTFASLDVAGTNYNVFTLNATGLGNVSLSVITKFGVILNWDMDNTAPANAVGQRRITIRCAEAAGATDTKLVLIHSAAAAQGSGPSGAGYFGGGVTHF